MKMAPRVLLLLVVGLVVVSYQTRMLSLCSYLSWRAVAGVGAASLVVALPRTQRFLFVFLLALAAAHLVVAMTALGEAQLVETASVGFFPSVYLWLL